ncbi:MAG: T9SS type A sorting domain-containing protein [Fluviicola sp.]|nr:T9SS type A sorting domain-containing protein [Fluviicola sp.]
MKTSLFTLLILTSFASLGQSWTKIYSPSDSIWIGGAAYFNKGDTIVFIGKSDANWLPEATQILVSMDGGNQFVLDTTPLHLQQTYCPSFQALPLSNQFLAAKLNPNQGVYQFQGINAWSVHSLGFINCLFGEIDAANLFFVKGSDSKIYTVAANGGTPVYTNYQLSQSCSVTYTKGNRLFLGSTLGAIYYVDQGDFSSIQTSVLPAWAASNPVTHFFESGGILYAVVFQGGGAKLIKTLDNGVNWTELPNPFGPNSFDPKPEDIYGLPDGRIYYIKPGALNNIFVSTDEGLSVVQQGNGLPNASVPWNGKKFISNKNKLWLGVNQVNQTDFVRLDTLISGLYLLEDPLEVGAIDLPDNIQLHPNPSSDRIWFQNLPDEVVVEVVNALGIVVKKSALTNTNNEIEISSLPFGMYLLRIHSKTQTSTLYLLKN